MDPTLDEPNLALLFVKALAGQTANYFVVVGLVFLLVWKLGARVLASRRIPTRFDFSRAQLVREVLNTLVTLAIGTVSGVVIMTLYKNGSTKLSTGEDWTVLESLGAFVALIFFNDAWFYWWHRLRLPKWWVRVPPFKWTSSATFHSLHHSTFNGNYGLMTRFWDRLMDTEVATYEQVFVTRSEPEAAGPGARASSRPEGAREG